METNLTVDHYRVMAAPSNTSPGHELGRYASLPSAMRAKAQFRRHRSCVWVQYVHAAGSLASRDGEDYETVG